MVRFREAEDLGERWDVKRDAAVRHESSLPRCLLGCPSGYSIGDVLIADEQLHGCVAFHQAEAVDGVEHVERAVRLYVDVDVDGFM